jgi:succinate dehydrogenase / fumarate reductase cytochrome b subunit
LWLELRMKVLQSLSTTTGSKILVALTGLAMVGFLFGHLAGNLLALVGPDKYNEYAHMLISNPLLVPVEIGLIAILLMHMGTAVSVVVRGRQARPQQYAVKKWAGGPSRKTVSSTTMIVTGVIILGFLILHLRTFKYGPEYVDANTGFRDLYRLMVEVFQNPAYVVFYVVCMVLVGMHLRHGLSSAFQSLGLMPKSWSGRILRAGAALAVIVAAGFTLIPVYLYLFL